MKYQLTVIVPCYNSELYINPVEVNNRSVMNIPFTLKNSEPDASFLKAITVKYRNPPIKRYKTTTLNQ